MKNKINNAPVWAFMAAFFYLFAGLSLKAQQQHRTLSTYSNETEIKAISSITLADGFYIPAGKNVRIFTGASFKQCVPFLSALSANQNYVATRIFKMAGVNIANLDSARSACEVNQTIQYIDGLGRPLQTVTTQGNPGFQDIVQPIAYDAFGREPLKYLPYAETSGQNGSFRPTALTAQTSFFNSPIAGVTAIPNAAFSETRFEASPLNRVLERGSPGANWQLSNGHTQKLEYGTNTAGDIKLWRVVTGGATSTEAYAAGRLYKTTSKDENWKITDIKAGTIDEYKDLEGRVILKRVWETDTRSLATYYVYDDLGNLSYVLPPAVNENSDVATPINSFAETDDIFKQFIYGYHYDGRERVTEKKIPGKGWEYMVYNTLDQVVFSQDPNQLEQRRWLFTKYDALGRIVMTGLYGDAANRIALQASVNAQTDPNQPTLNRPLWENRDNANNNGLGTGYTDQTLPISNVLSYHTINYYDDYDFYNNSFGQPVAPQVGSSRTKSLLTGTRVTVLETNTKLLSVSYYDEDGRVVQVKASNHLGGTDITNQTYNFAGELTASIRTHTGSPGGAATTIATRYEYDHMGRKLATMESINGEQEVVLNKLEYNALGQLLTKHLHSTDNGSSFLQRTDYVYNERSWLKESNSNQFKMRLKYDDGTVPQYNGNIANQEWGTSYQNVYTYGYDPLNRLKSGVSTGVSMSEVLSYDVMGNIKTLNRDNSGIGTYNYQGNRLQSISSGPLATGAYMHDSNGNVITDGRNGVSLTYNYLNLPATATKTGLNLSYAYDASGNKLTKISNGVVRHYLSGIEYDGNQIDVIHTEEGVVSIKSGRYSYEYNITDNLGNTRYSFDVYNGGLRRIQEQDYYTFGKIRDGQYVFGEKNKYLYNGKELQEELGQFDYGARFYDPVIGRWNVIDPLVELNQENTSPYIYVLNNPILLTDPDGRYPDGPGDDLWEGIKQGFGGYFGNIKQAVLNPGATIKSQFTSEAILDNVLNTSTFGVYSTAKEGMAVSSAASKGDLSVLGKAVGNKLAEATVVLATEGAGKAIGAIKSVNTLTKSESKAISSFKKNIVEHNQKLKEYKADPMKFDNKGTLKNAPKELQAKIIAGRVKHLEKEIQTFKENIQKIKNKDKQ